MKNLSLIFTITILAITNLMAAASDVTIETIDNYNSWNKKALVIKNGYIELVILPEIGGRVIRYGFEGDEYMFINSETIDQNYNPDTDINGPWGNGNVGYGGYKVWPAPQSVWGWPPPPHLAWGTYSYEIEHSSADSVIVYLESEEETSKTPGLVFSRRYRVYKNSTKVCIEQTIINNNSEAQDWSIWDVTQAINQHGTDADYSNFSVYFPVNKDDIWASGNSFLNSVTSVNDNLSKYKYNGGGKLYSFVNEGWESFVDEKDKQTYTKMFSIEEGNFPDDGANFEIYGGGNYIEIEVLSPIISLDANGGSYSYNEDWYAANLGGAILKSTKSGAVKSKLTLTASTLTGEYGIYNKGYLKINCLDLQNNVLQSGDPLTVDAAENFVLNQSISLPEGTTKIQLNAYTSSDKLIGELDSWGESESSVDEKKNNPAISIYPTNCRKGDVLHLSIGSENPESIKASIIDLNSRTVLSLNKLNFENNIASINLPETISGVYFLRVQSPSSTKTLRFVKQ
jgi:hypothetical protein